MSGKERTGKAAAARAGRAPERSASRGGRTAQPRRDEAEHYRVIHHVPGRLRLVVPGLRTAPKAELLALARELKRALIPGKVLDVSANPLTGSVTLTYDAAAVDIISWVEALLRREDVSRVLGRDDS